MLVVASGGAAQGDKGTPVTPAAILRKAIAAADAAPRKDSLLRGIAVTLANAGHTDEALRLAKADQETAQRVLRAAAFARARNGDFEEALRTARRLGAPESRQAIATIAAIRAFSGDGPGARRIVEDELKDEPERSYASKGVALALEQAGHLDEAARTFEAIPSLWEKARGCRSAARARLKAGDIPGALLAAGRSRRLATEYMAQTPRRKYDFGIEPDWFRDRILGEIALEKARMGDGLGARQTAESITSHYSRALTVAKAAAILARAGDKAAAKVLIKWTFNLVDVVGLHGLELTEIAAAETLAGETEAARKTFIRALGTVGPAVMNQSLVPDAQARAGDLEGAMQTLQAIGDSGARQRALGYIARTLAKAGDAHKAVEIAGMIDSVDDRAVALSEVCLAQVEAGDRAGALRTVRRVAAIEGPLADVTLQKVARAWAKQGDVRGALEWVNERSTPSTKSLALIGVVEGMLPAVSGPNMQGEQP